MSNAELKARVKNSCDADKRKTDSWAKNVAETTTIEEAESLDDYEDYE